MGEATMKSVRMSDVAITALDERTFRIVAPTGSRVWGGLGPDSLALGRVSLGPVTWRPEEPEVFYVTCTSEVGVYVCDVPHTPEVVPFDPIFEAPHTCLEDEPSTFEQLRTLRAGVAECLAYAARHTGLDEQLRVAARRDRIAGRGDRVSAVAEEYLSSPSQEAGGAVIVGTGELVRVPTDRLADAVERITRDRPRNHVQVRTLMRRWARLRGVPRKR